jgi:hypothetical protein
MNDSKFIFFRMERRRKGLCGGVNTRFVVIQQSLNAGTLVFEWNSILVAALAGGVAYPN